MSKIIEVTIQRENGREPLVLELEDSIAVEPVSAAEKFMALFKAGDYGMSDQLLMNWGMLIGKRLTRDSAVKLEQLETGVRDENGNLTQHPDPLVYIEQVRFLIGWYKGVKPFLEAQRKSLMNSEFLAP